MFRNSHVLSLPYSYLWHTSVIECQSIIIDWLVDSIIIDSIIVYKKKINYYYYFFILPKENANLFFYEVKSNCNGLYHISLSFFKFVFSKSKIINNKFQT